jgi:predicted 3-demethylubiquinone-9 3-methyltransferase (glyoxalase superfamily)
MMTNKFAIGDRVNIHSSQSDHGTIMAINLDDEYNVTWDSCKEPVRDSFLWNPDELELIPDQTPNEKHEAWLRDWYGIDWRTSVTSQASVSNGGPTAYYDLPEDATTLNDLIEAQDMNFAVGNIFKATFRLGKKLGVDREYDLNKIIYFAQRELNRITNTKD